MAQANSGRWLLRRPPAEAGFLLFALPYAGVGASYYREWPVTVAGARICPLQPPGREHRMREAPHRTHAAFAADLVDYLTGYVDRPYAFIGHCGAVPFALETILALQDRGLPLPARLIASSWGAPHRRLYGHLNFVDLAIIDLEQEVRDLFARMGASIREDVVGIAADVLRLDLEVQRSYRYDPSRFLPVPATVVGWTGDDVVPCGEALTGWEDIAQARYELLEGEHAAFMRCPPSLQRLIARDLSLTD